MPPTPRVPGRRRTSSLEPSSSFFPPANRPTSDWEITLCGDLSDRQSDLINRLVELPRRSRGLIYFDSNGGNVYTGLCLASLIRLRGLHAIGVVTGECSSAALFPFAACRERFVTPHATLLFHPIRWQSDEDVRYEEAVEWARHFKTLEIDLDQLLSRLFDMDFDKLQQWTRPGRFITGPEMIEAGLAKMVDLFEDDIWKQL
ncbi:ClpP family protease [Thalassoroseus pseudoceratinae]|uniref:ClpP family protease n=1 Tax=Thalassoroseus pseudoceratinae TaxID=2713176 RepID=UPI00141E2C2F|nr:ATP-dependent Clp protease proteolytic subunit [Thalassoroseus pseudoceratinae]